LVLEPSIADFMLPVHQGAIDPAAVLHATRGGKIGHNVPCVPMGGSICLPPVLFKDSLKECKPL